MSVASVKTHKLPVEVFREICHGPASAVSIGVLRAAQYSLRMLRLVALFNQISASPQHGPAMNVLTVLNEIRPEIFADFLLHPLVGVWLVRALGSATELGYLNSLAAAVAIGAKYPFAIDIPVPVLGGLAVLPALGVVAAPGASLITLSGAPPGLVPATRHRVEINNVSLDVHIEDCDPYREFGDPRPPQPLEAEQLHSWRRLLDEAWRVLVEQHRASAIELSAGLRTLIPITSPDGIVGASCTSAFGAIAVSIRDTPVKLAETLVHELQHSKLNALLDLCQLVRSDAQNLWYVPWRDDPRPMTGVLHGIYAFVSDAEFWRVELEHAANTGTEADPDAAFVFALRCHQVRQVLTSLDGTDELTEHGWALVAAVNERLAVCETVAVPKHIHDTVTQKVDEHRLEWNSRS
jgi:HEXXH motif-containing protein